MLRLVLMGLPGAGKGTQGELLSERFGIPHISTGAMFREAIQSNSSLGQKAKALMDRGELVPDDVAGDIVLARLQKDDCRRGFVLDGYPRTVPQAMGLDDSLTRINIAIEAAVNIQITPEEAIKRISGRLICSQCGATFNRKLYPTRAAGICDVCHGPLVQRPDDTEETARNRLKIYLEQTHPVVTYYEQRGVLLTVPGQGPIETVFDSISTGLVQMGVREA